MTPCHSMVHLLSCGNDDGERNAIETDLGACRGGCGAMLGAFASWALELVHPVADGICVGSAVRSKGVAGSGRDDIR